MLALFFTALFIDLKLSKNNRAMAIDSIDWQMQ
jgi:hypothetical protein